MNHSARTLADLFYSSINPTELKIQPNEQSGHGITINGDIYIESGNRTKTTIKKHSY